MKKFKIFELLLDEEWIELLTKEPTDEKAHEYFFYVKCAPMLKYISIQIYNSNDFTELIGEFYVLLSKDDWYVLRKFNSKNNATLNSYLSRCAINHFLWKKKQEKKFIQLYTEENPDISNMLNSLTNEEYIEMPPVMQAYEKLEPRDKDFIRLLILDGKSSLEAADQLWPYVKSTSNWQDLPVTRVQSTISMIKHRAILRLTTEVNRLI